jgi:hypothetical protein
MRRSSVGGDSETDSGVSDGERRFLLQRIDDELDETPKESA